MLAVYFLLIYLLVLLNLLRRIRKNDCTRFSLLWKAKWNENVSRKQKTKHFISIEYHTRNCRSCPLGFPVDTGKKNGAQETLTYLIISMSILIVSMYGICATCADMLLSSLLKSQKNKIQKRLPFLQPERLRQRRGQWVLRSELFLCWSCFLYYV